MTRVAKNRILLGVGLAGIIVSLFDPLPIKILGALLAAAALVVQYRTGGAETVEVGLADWQQVGAEYVVDVPFSRHGRHSPQVTTSMRNAQGSYEKVECDVSAGPSGDVRVAAGERFEGRIEIT